RSMNNKVELSIPFKDKIEKFLFSNGIVKQRSDNGKLEPIHRPQLLNRTDLEIVTIYNAELRGICNYYGLASNFNKLIYFNYLMEYSCLKTLAGKHRSKVSKIRAMYKDGTGKWAIPYETKTVIKKMYFANYADCKGKKFTDIVPQTAKNYSHDVTTLESRLKAKICEVCGCTESDRYEIHHVNKVKNLKGKSEWEKIMIAKRRKTIVVCHKCHMAIHHGEKK
ncbi:group II intron reverse transcriptase/maturase, partial [Clostridioides difficile]|nr:group II intron reverse transcriptase/maturase [Clostridioides difficile]